MEPTVGSIEIAMSLLIQAFSKHAGKEDGNNTLTPAEFKALLGTEMPNLFQGAKNPEEVDKVFKGLDANRDKQIDFNEFLGLVAYLTCTLNEEVGSLIPRP